VKPKFWFAHLVLSTESVRFHSAFNMDPYLAADLLKIWDAKTLRIWQAVPRLLRGQHRHDTSHANMPCVVLVLDDVVCQAAGIQCSIVLLLWHAMSDLIVLIMWFNKPSFTKHGLNVHKPTSKIKRVACNKIYLKAHIQSSLNAADIFFNLLFMFVWPFTWFWFCGFMQIVIL
jgi:hypothetical protein